MPFALLLSVLLLGTGSDSSGDTAVVATVGPYVITSRDLLESYEFGPSFVKRKPYPLRQHLQYMIDERLMALGAERFGLDTSRFVRDRVAGLEEDLAVEELYRADILSNMRLSDQETEEAVEKARTEIRFRWLYAASVGEAKAIRKHIVNERRFDSLYARQGVSAGGHVDRELQATALQLEHDNPEFAETIRRLKPREISQPVEGPDGYYIVRVDEVWRNPLLSESGYGETRTKATETLREMRAEELSREYVRQKMIVVNPVIRAEGFNVVRAYLADKGLSRDKQLQWQIPATFMTEAGPRPLRASEEFLSRQLVTYGSESFSVRDYVRWFEIRQFQLHTGSLGAFNASVKKTIWKMVQDKLLSKEAYRRGFQFHASVVRETDKWHAKLLYLAGRSYWMKTIHPAEADVRKRYETQKHRYRDEHGSLLSFAKARDRVWGDLYYEAEFHLLSRLLQELKKEYRPVVNEETLARLEKSVEPEKNPLDVIFYKPGGTFPRVAYPTIDEAWQRYPH